MVEVCNIAEQIEKRIKLLERGRSELKTTALAKAQTSAQYDKMMAIVLIRLKNVQSLSLEGEIIEKPPASIMDKVARGICWREKLAADQAEAEYKCVVSKMDSIQAELNGYQSIYRHLEKL